VPANVVHGDVMHGETLVARDHHDALLHGLAVESARGGVDADLGARHLARIACATSAFNASTWSSGKVRLTATTTSTNSLSPTWPHPHAVDRHHAAHASRDPSDGGGGARRRGVGQRLDGAAAEPPAG
jgi:hypothetical protein